MAGHNTVTDSVFIGNVIILFNIDVFGIRFNFENIVVKYSSSRLSSVSASLKFCALRSLSLPGLLTGSPTG